MADKSKLEIFLTLAQEEFKKGLAETKKAIASLEGKINLNLETDKARSAVRSLLDEIKIGFAREIGAKAFEGLTGIFQSAVGQAQNLAQQIFNVGKETESLKSRLAQAVGGEGAGTRIFQELTKFAADTPLEINEIVNAFISLKQRGVEPTIATITKLGDVAKSQGKSLQQVVEAVLDVNNSERFTEFGIKSETVGEKVRLTFQGVTKEVDRTAEAVAKAVGEFGEMEGIVGGMDRASKTIEGRLSTLSDAFKANLVTIFDGFQPAISGIIDFISKLAEQVNANLKNAFLGLNLEAKQFADYLNANPEIISNIASGIAELAGNLASSLLSGAKQLAEYLSKNPDAIAQAVEAIKGFGQAVINIANTVGAILKGFGDIGTKIGELSKSDFFKNLEGATGNFLGLGKLSEALDRAKQQTGDFETAFNQLGKSIGGSTEKGAIGLSTLYNGIKAISDEAINSAKQVSKISPVDPKKAFKESVDKLKEANAEALNTTRNTQALLITEIQTRITKGALLESEGSKQIAAIKAAEAQQLLNIAKKNLADIEKLPSADPETKKKLKLAAEQEVANATRNLIADVASAEKAANDAAIAAIRRKGEEQQKALQFQIQENELKAKSLEIQQQLNSASANLKAAQNEANIAGLNLELANLQRAVELRGQLSQLTAADGEQRRLIETELAALGQSTTQTQLQGQQQINAKRQELRAAEKQALMDNQVQEQKSLELQQLKVKLDADRNILLAKQAELTAKIAEAEAQRTLKTAEANGATAQMLTYLKQALEFASKGVQLAGQQVSASEQYKGQLDTIAQKERDTLAIKQGIAVKQLEQTQRAAEFGDKMELAKTKTQGVKTAVDSVSSSLDNAAKSADSVAIATGRIANQSELATNAAGKLVDKFGNLYTGTVQVDEGLEAVNASINKAFNDMEAFVFGFEQFANGAAVMGGAGAFIKTADPTILRQKELNLLKEMATTDGQRQKIEEELGAMRRSNAKAELAELQKKIDINNELISLTKRSAAPGLVSGLGPLLADLSKKINMTRPNERVSLLNSDYGYKAFKGIPSFAGGVENFNGGIALVHQGEALVKMPRGTDVIPKGALRGTSTSNSNQYNITIQDRPNPGADLTNALLSLSGR